MMQLLTNRVLKMIYMDIMVLKIDRHKRIINSSKHYGKIPYAHKLLRDGEVV
jgi:hypothetical protein